MDAAEDASQDSSDDRTKEVGIEVMGKVTSFIFENRYLEEGEA